VKIKIPSAKEARQNTLSQEDILRHRIAEYIQVAMNNGHYSVCTRMTLDHACLTELLNLGYQVSTDHDARSYTLTHISWKE
jgi:hypothetical protein